MNVFGVESTKQGLGGSPVSEIVSPWSSALGFPA
jgi:hypothetical protein